LSYVRGIVDAATSQGIELQILTQASAVESSEWGIHLGGVEGVAVKTFTARNFTARHLPELLRTQRREGRAVVLPEVDRFLHVVLLAFVARALPKSTTIIAMRPPTWSSPRKWPMRLFKILALRLLAATRSVNVLLLEDQLAHGHTRIWRWPLSDPALRLDDPADDPTNGNELPPELSSLPRTTKLIALVGAIDERKRVPLILDGWDLGPERPDCQLVVAGLMQPAVRHVVQQHRCNARNDFTVIDRYLPADELACLIDRSVALLVLFDGGLSSGTLISAAQTGRWAITARGGRPATVALEHGFGIETELTPAGIQESITEALARPIAPSPMPLRDRTAFGDSILIAALGEDRTRPWTKRRGRSRP